MHSIDSPGALTSSELVTILLISVGDTERERGMELGSRIILGYLFNQGHISENLRHVVRHDLRSLLDGRRLG